MKIAVAFLLVAVCTTFDTTMADEKVTDGAITSFTVSALKKAENAMGCKNDKMCENDKEEKIRRQTCFFEQLYLAVCYAVRHSRVSVTDMQKALKLQGRSEMTVLALQAAERGTINAFVRKHYMQLDLEMKYIVKAFLRGISAKMSTLDGQLSVLVKLLGLKLPLIGVVLRTILPTVFNVLNLIGGLLGVVIGGISLGGK
ncbi:uncharacterized protein O3C94_008161 [Discoglossus pictus]